MGRAPARPDRHGMQTPSPKRGWKPRLRQEGETRAQKNASREGRRFGKQVDYLLSLRRMTIARAPRPSRLIVAGSGTGEATFVKVAVKLPLPAPCSVAP